MSLVHVPTKSVFFPFDHLNGKRKQPLISCWVACKQECSTTTSGCNFLHFCKLWLYSVSLCWHHYHCMNPSRPMPVIEFCVKRSKVFFLLSLLIAMSFLLFYGPPTGACLLVRGCGSIWQATLPKWPVYQRICISTWRSWHPGTWNIVIEAAWLGIKIHTWHRLGKLGFTYPANQRGFGLLTPADGCPTKGIYIRNEHGHVEPVYAM